MNFPCSPIGPPLLIPNRPFPRDSVGDGNIRFWSWISTCRVARVTDGEEYCLPEVFHAECASTELIVVDKALFGRLELGRCVTRNYGHIGCAVDVLPVVDLACSGRRSCDLSVSDPALVRTKPCPKDFASYLDADYSCVPGNEPLVWFPNIALW